MKELDMFRWVCVVLAAVAVGACLLMLNDIRVTAKSSLLDIAEKSKVTATTMAEVSKDVKELRTLAGATGNRDKSFVVYANSIMEFIQAAGKRAKIGVGRKMKDALPVDEWVAGTRKEAIYLVFVEKKKSDILKRLCQTAVLHSDFYIQFPPEPPQKLEDWLKANHPETKALEAEAKAGG
jgi:hypothetical protein